MSPRLIKKAYDLANSEFLSELGRDMPASERLICCSFAGDPNVVANRDWRPIPWKKGGVRLRSDHNNYVAISSFTQSPDGSYRRRTAQFAAGRALMVDDVGTKVDEQMLIDLKVLPSAIIQTSPGNYQWWFFLKKPCTDRDTFNRIIKGFIEQKLLGNDPGMAGVNRVGRLPVGRNVKRKYGDGGYEVNCVHWEPDRRYRIEELAKRLGVKSSLTEAEKRAAERCAELAHFGADARAEYFKNVVDHLERLDVFKAQDFNIGGWREIHCPWKDKHTDRADSGAAIGKPNADNGFTGAFQCHHGHCQKKTWRDFTDWLNDILIEEQ